MITSAIEKLSSGMPAAIFLRHGERFDIADNENGLKVGLTSKGKKDAFELGRNFPLRGEFIIYHSPVDRCKETAEAMQKGFAAAGKSVGVAGSLSGLGGPLIKGRREVMLKEIKRLGDGFNRQWLKGNLADLMRSPEETAKSSLLIAAEQLNDAVGNIINITHDLNIIAFREYYFGLRHEDIGIPEFLDGFAVQRHIDGTFSLLSVNKEARAGIDGSRI